MLENQSGVDSYEDTVNDLAPGTKLMHGQYTIEQYLSSGGFGITYLAQDSLNRLVVIKECFPSSFCRRTQMMVRPHSRENAEELSKIVSLFTQEALSLARVEHPNIVGVHQVFEENNTAYMALDFVRGRDLQEIVLVNKIAMKPEQVTSILTKILDAIGHVHKNGLLHRDISPDNIIVRDDGEPVLIDFGAAREQSTRKTRVLSAMQIVKDGYSPQEFYVADSNQSPSCDLYSLAATFYHIITGERPPDAQRRITALASREPDPYRPLSGMETEYDATFCSVLDRALQVLPKDRVQSADEWLSELGRIGSKRRISKRVLEPEIIPPKFETETTEGGSGDEDNAPEQIASEEARGPQDFEPFEVVEGAPKKRSRPRTSVKRPIEAATIMAGAPILDPDAFDLDDGEGRADAAFGEHPNKSETMPAADLDDGASETDQAREAILSSPDEFPDDPVPEPVVITDEPKATIISRVPSRLLLPSIISVRNGDEDALGDGARGSGSRFLITAMLAGVIVLGGLYLMRDGNFSGANGDDVPAALAEGSEPSLAPAPDASAPTIAATAPKAPVDAPLVFPNSAEPVVQSQLPTLPVSGPPVLLTEAPAVVAPAALAEAPGVALAPFEQVRAAALVVALPDAKTFEVSLPLSSAPPAALQTPEIAATEVAEPASPDAKAAIVEVAPPEVALTSIAEGVVFASQLVDDQWVTTVAEASPESVLQVGDIIIADAATGTELNSPESIQAMLDARRAEGRGVVELAIERNGAFRLESLGL